MVDHDTPFDRMLAKKKSAKNNKEYTNDGSGDTSGATPEEMKKKLDEYEQELKNDGKFDSESGREAGKMTTEQMYLKGARVAARSGLWNMFRQQMVYLNDLERRDDGSIVDQIDFLTAIAELYAKGKTTWVDGTKHDLLEGMQWLRDADTEGYLIPTNPNGLFQKGFVKFPTVSGESVETFNKRAYYDLTTRATDVLQQSLYIEDDTVIGDINEGMIHKVLVRMAEKYYESQGYHVETYVFANGQRWDLIVYDPAPGQHNTEPKYVVEVEASTYDSQHVMEDQKAMTELQDIPTSDDRTHTPEEMLALAEPVWITPSRDHLQTLLQWLYVFGSVTELKPPQSPHDSQSDGLYKIPKLSLERFNNRIERNVPSEKINHVETCASMQGQLLENYPELMHTLGEPRDS